MQQFISAIAIAAIVGFGAPWALAGGASDPTKESQQKKHSREGEMSSKQGGEEPAPKGERRELGAGPMGEESKGGSGQSGTKGLPPGDAPGHEGAEKEKAGQAPTSGGH